MEGLLATTGHRLARIGPSGATCRMGAGEAGCGLRGARGRFRPWSPPPPLSCHFLLFSRQKETVKDRQLRGWKLPASRFQEA